MTRDRQPVFSNAALAAASVVLVREAAVQRGVQLYAYCLMPDHLHLLMSPSSETTIIDFMRIVKSLSARAALTHGVTRAVWQPRFYDHFLRVEESVQEVVEYILANPVRRGLVAEARQYPYGGPLVFDLT